MIKQNQTVILANDTRIENATITSIEYYDAQAVFYPVVGWKMIYYGRYNGIQVWSHFYSGTASGASLPDRNMIWREKYGN